MTKQSVPVRAGDAFVAKFKREPASASDCAWLNGYAEALTILEGEPPVTRLPTDEAFCKAVALDSRGECGGYSPDAVEEILKLANARCTPNQAEPKDDLVHGERAEAIGLLRLAWGVCVNEKRPALANEITSFIDRLSGNRGGST